MVRLQFIPGIRRCFVALMLVVVTVALVGCGGDDESASAGGEPDSERIAALETQMKSFQDYIVAQAQNERGSGGTVTNGAAAERQYTLAKENASENELEIVSWMADCTARTYLNPNLPEEVFNREIEESERRMWESLEAGQYTSFEAFIGMAFSFCQARIVEENRE